MFGKRLEINVMHANRGHRTHVYTLEIVGIGEQLDDIYDLCPNIALKPNNKKRYEHRECAVFGESPLKDTERRV